MVRAAKQTTLESQGSGGGRVAHSGLRLGPATFLLIAAGFVLLIFIRGNAHGRASAEETARVAQPTAA